MSLLKSWLFLAFNLVISIFKRVYTSSEKDKFLNNFRDEGLLPLNPEIIAAIRNSGKCMVCGYCDLKGEFSLIPHLTKELSDYSHFLEVVETTDFSNFFCPFEVKPEMIKNGFKST